MAEKGLGRGLGAIFGDDSSSSAGEEILSLSIGKVEPREDQPRSLFDEEALSELAESIGEYGIIQPITVRRLESGYYQIIAGERRWRAARIAGLKEVPVRVLEADDLRAMELALVENLQREDLNPIEEALGYQRLVQEHGMTQEQAAKSVGKSRPTVANSLRLLNLSEPVLELVRDGLLSAGHARTLVPIGDADAQLRVANQVIDQQLSVRQTEKLAARTMNEREELGKQGVKQEQVDYIEEVEKQLTSALGRKVKISRNPKKGRIELSYYDSEDLENLITGLNLLGSSKSGGRNGK